MLHLILGRSGYGKTEYVFSSIKRLVENGEENILLITPEQFSFIAERRLLSNLDEKNVYKVENASFSRLSSEIAKLYGGDELPTLSNGAKAVMMKRAIEMVQDKLVLFSRYAASPSFVMSAVKIYDEMKACRVSCEDIVKAGKAANSETLKQKLYDISLIISAYDSVINGKYYDSADSLTRLYEKLLSHNYFEGRTVFIDGFYGFVAQEYKIIEIILKQARDVYVTFCTDVENDSDLFSYINMNVRILKDVAKKSGVKIASPIKLTDNYRSNSASLSRVERLIFTNTKGDFEENLPISIYSAKNISDECDRVALEIAGLLREGYRADDIAVVTRDLNKYKKELEFSFDKYKVPYFNDERQAIGSQPIILFVKFLLRTAIYNLRSNDIFSLLKTGLTELSSDEIGNLENYAYIWKINGSAWKKEFVNSTKGFVENISDSDMERIEAVNKSREYVVQRLEKFSRSVKNRTPLEICKAIYFTLIDFSCDDKLRDLAMELEKNGKSSLSKQQGRVWDLLMQTLDSLATLGENEVVSLDDFYKTFNLMIANEDLGSLPSGLDNVQLGSVDRMRLDNPKAVFVVGANEGEFPSSVASSGLLSESDRVELIQNDFKLYSYGETLNAQERFFAYMAMSAPSERLFVSFGGSDSAESSIVTSLSLLFGELKYTYSSDKLDIDCVESVDNAFEVLATNYNMNDEFVASLKSYFSNREDYSGRLQAVEALVNNVNPSISDKSISTALFGKNMYFSASRIEDYYNCAFKYFCKVGLGAKPIVRAEMNPAQSGTVIHYVLEQIIKNTPKQEFTALSTVEIRLLVNRYLTEYLNTKMGDSSEYTKRFKYQFMRLSKMLNFVVEHLRDELAQSDFVPEAFELKIGDGSDDEPVKSCSIPIGDGGFITIKGSVDRVDTFVKGNQKYVRVVDYKSGQKDFSLSDIMYGLNLQMLVYLFAISRTDNEYRGIGAGVLYMHASRNVLPLESKDFGEAEQKTAKSFKMKGLVLNDEEHSIAENMEHDLKGKYIPVKSGKNGISGDIVSLEELGRIARKTDMLISQMGLGLHNGVIAQNPVSGKGHDKTCEYCEYSDICMNRVEVEVREMKAFSKDEVLESIREELGDNVD